MGLTESECERGGESFFYNLSMERISKISGNFKSEGLAELIERVGFLDKMVNT